MRIRFLIAMSCLTVWASCSPSAINAQFDLAPGELGYIKVDGVKKASVHFGYQSNIGYKTQSSYWYLFDKEQLTGNLDYDQSLVVICGVTDKEGQYPSSIHIAHIPGIEGLNLDGFQRMSDGRFSCKRNDETYYVSINAFSFSLDAQEGPWLKADISITSDLSASTVRIVFDGHTPNDGAPSDVMD